MKYKPTLTEFQSKVLLTVGMSSDFDNIWQGINSCQGGTNKKHLESALLVLQQKKYLIECSGIFYLTDKGNGYMTGFRFGDIRNLE